MALAFSGTFQPDRLTKSVTCEEILKVYLCDAHDAANLVGDQLAAHAPSPNGTDRNIKHLGDGPDRVELRFPAIGFGRIEASICWPQAGVAFFRTHRTLPY